MHAHTLAQYYYYYHHMVCILYRSNRWVYQAITYAYPYMKKEKINQNEIAVLFLLHISLLMIEANAIIFFLSIFEFMLCCWHTIYDWRFNFELLLLLFVLSPECCCYCSRYLLFEYQTLVMRFLIFLIGIFCVVFLLLSLFFQLE